MDKKIPTEKIRRLAQLERDIPAAQKVFVEKQQTFLTLLADDNILDNASDIAEQAADACQAALDAQKHLDTLSVEHQDIYNSIINGDGYDEEN
jgi:hypothetical protein